MIIKTTFGRMAGKTAVICMKQKFYLVLMAFLLILGLPLRLYQFWVNIDESTGFFIVRDWTVWAMIGLVLGGGALVWVLIFFDRHYRKDALHTDMRGLGFLAFLSGGAITYYEFLQIYRAATGAGVGASQFLIDLFGALSGFSIVLLGIDFILKSRPSRWSGYLLLVVPVWSLMRALQFFLANQTIVPISQNLMRFGFMLSCVLFFLFHSQAIAHAGTLIGQRSAIAWGSAGVILGMTALIPLYVFGLLGGDKPFGFLETASFLDAAVVVYMMSYTSTLLINTGEA